VRGRANAGLKDAGRRSEKPGRNKKKKLLGVVYLLFGHTQIVGKGMKELPRTHGEERQLCQKSTDKSLRLLAKWYKRRSIEEGVLPGR